MSIPSILIWVILRLNGIKCSVDEVKKGRYDHNIQMLNKDRFEKSAIDCNVLLEHSKEIYKEKENRRQQLLEKGNTLLTICGIAIPVLAYISTLNINLYVLLFTLILLFTSIVLLIHLIRITTFVQPNIDESILSNETEGDNLIRNISYDYYYCSVMNSNVIDYLADVFRSSYRTFILCIILTFIIYAYTVHDNLVQIPSDNKNNRINLDSNNTIIKNFNSRYLDSTKNE